MHFPAGPATAGATNVGTHVRGATDDGRLMASYGKGRTVVAIAGWSGRVSLGSVPCSSARGSVNEDQEWNVECYLGRGGDIR